MRLPPTRASAVVLSLVEGFTDDPGPRAGAAALLSVFDQAGWLTDGYSIEDMAEGQLTTLRFNSPPPRATLQVPGLPVTARVALSENGADISLRVLQDAAGRWIEVSELSAAIEIDTSLLRPVDGGGGGVQIDAALRIRVDRQWNVELKPRASLSLPWSRLANLPIELKLDKLLFDISPDTTPSEILSLGYDGSFVGIYAETATLRLLPELRFGDERGLVLKASSFALSQRGLTARLGYYWRLDHDGTAISPTSEMTASLLDQLVIGLERIEVSIRDSMPEHFLARGVVALPLLPTLLGIEFGLQVRPGGSRLQLHLASLAPIRCDLGVGRLNTGRLSIQGDLESDHLACRGQLEQVSLVLGPVGVDVGSAEVRLEHSANADELNVRLGEVELGPLGSVPGVELVMRETRDSGATKQEFYLTAQLTWQDISQRIQLPANLPVPADDASVTVKVSAQDGPDGVETSLEMAVALSDFQSFGDWLPAELRPEVRRASLSLSITYAEGDFADAGTASQLQVTASGALELRLPDLSLGNSRDLFSVTTGDAEGWVAAQFSAGVNPAGDPFFDVGISDALSIAVQLPGLAQDTPPIKADIDKLELEIQNAGGGEGAMKLTGRLELRPILPPRSIPIAQHVERMFREIGLSQVSGECTLMLRFRDDRLKLELEAAFVDAGVKIDLFDVLSNLSAGLGGGEGGGSVQLSLPAAVQLSKVSVSLGSLEETAADLPFAVNLIATASIGGLQADCVFGFSDDEVEIGIRGHEVAPGRWNTDIPLSLPKLPIKVSDLDLLAANRWRTALFRKERADDLAESLGVSDIDDSDDPRVVRARGELDAATFFLEQIVGLRKELSPNARDTFINLWVRNFLGALEGLTGWTANDSDARLRLEQFSLKLPLSDPRNIGVEGTLAILGFADDDPLAGLNGTRLSAGISADLIYFALEGTGDPIELPAVGRYRDGRVSLGELRIGYGYTSNSFNVVVDGTVELPPALNEDIDTSRELGIGIRPPDRTSLYFRLGVIPVPGPIPAVPVFDFNLDLRAPNSPALVDADKAIPYWDGLQLIARGLFHVDLKHLAFSPMLGPLPIINVRYDGDWLIGNDDLGFTVIADNVHILLGLAGTPPITIPFFVDPAAPYFDNLVVNLRLAGFKLNFNVQHPFPSFNPLALLELFALLSDPSVQLDPDGPLANVLRLTVKNVHIAPPQWARQLFPLADALVEKPGEYTLNVGTAIAALQSLLTAGTQTLDALTEAGSSLRWAVATLPERVIPDVDAILAGLPPELRKLRLGGSLGGFEARFVILLVSPQAAVDALNQRDNPPPATQPAPYAWGDATRPNSASAVPLPLGTRGKRESNPYDPGENLFLGIEFEGFSAADLQGVIEPDASAIVVGANVKVFKGQRYRFLGVVSSAGSFLMVTAAEVSPLYLRVAGMTVGIPFEASAAMRLEGRTRRDGFSGSIRAQGRAEWRPIPGVLFLDMGTKSEPVSLDLYSNGAFRVRGAVDMSIFQAQFGGTVDLSNTHCFVSGFLSYAAGEYIVRGSSLYIISLELEAEGRVGPGSAFRLAGSGSLRILEQTFTNVTGLITNRHAEISASIMAEEATTALTQLFPLALDGDLSGTVDLGRHTNPSFSLKGRLKAQVFGFWIEGAGHISSSPGRGVCVGVEGSLVWDGHTWLGGSLEVGTNGFLSVGGRTHFSLPLSPQGTGNVLFASLFCEVNVGGHFTINPGQGLASWEADASCALGLLLPRDPDAQDDSDNHFIPLASYSARGDGDAELRMKILSVEGFQIPGISDIEILVPDPELDEDEKLIDIDLVNVGIDNVLEAYIPYIEGTPGPRPRDWLGYIGRDNFMSIPDVNGWKTIKLGQLTANPITIYLTFTAGALQLEIESGGRSDWVPLIRPR